MRGEKRSFSLLFSLPSPSGSGLCISPTSLYLSFCLSPFLSLSPVLSCHSNLCENSSQDIEALKKKKIHENLCTLWYFPPPLSLRSPAVYCSSKFLSLLVLLCFRCLQPKPCSEICVLYGIADVQQLVVIYTTSPLNKLYAEITLKMFYDTHRVTTV